MKRVILHILLGIALCCASCSEEHNSIVQDHIPAAFTTRITGSEAAVSRASNASWTVGDKVGIHMSSSKTLGADALFREYYVADADKGILTPSTLSDTWFYPLDDSDVWFYAFYPYGSSDYTKSGNTLTFTMPTNQSEANAMENFDFLYYKNDKKNYSGTYPHAALAFEHRFSKIVLNVTAAADMPADFITAFNDLTLTLSDFPATADCDLTDGSVTAIGNNVVVTPRKGNGADANTYTFEAIVFPHTATNAPLVTFNLTMAGLDTPITFPLNKEYTSGTSYIYNFTLGLNEVDLTGTYVKDWTEETGEAGTYLRFSPEANSYIVKPGESVLIPVKHAYRYYKEYGGTFLGASDTFHVEVLWSDVAGNGAPTSGTDIDPSYVVSPSSAVADVKAVGQGPTSGGILVRAGSKSGNAVVALRKTATGDILWSWHIWVVDYDPNENTWTNNGFTFMERNLGAMHNDKGVDGSTGLHYQWGRKDPFPGSASATVDKEPTIYYYGKDEGSYYVKSDGVLTEDLTVGEVTISTSLTQPECFYINQPEWCLDLDSSSELRRWNNTDGKKAIDDPCPYGWKVPTNVSKELSPWFGFASSDENPYWDPTNKGSTFSDSWWPAAGNRSNSFGLLYAVSTFGRYWSASVTDNKGCYLYFNEGYVGPTSTSNKSYGYSVRCVLSH